MLLRGLDGKIVEIPDEQAGQAIAGGFEPITATDAGTGLAVQERPTSGALGGAGAAASGYLAGATLGLSDYAFKGLLDQGDFERLAADREAHPIISGLGQVAGAVAGGPTPSGLISREAAGFAQAGREIGGAQGVARALAAGGVEGAIQNAGMYLSDTALGDRELSAEALIGSLGPGFEFGAAGGAVALGIERGAIAARRLFSRVGGGAERAAQDAEQAWQTKYASTLEANDAAADIARAKLATAEQARREAGVVRDRTAAAVAEAKAGLTPQAEAQRMLATPAPANALDPNAAMKVFGEIGFDAAATGADAELAALARTAMESPGQRAATLNAAAEQEISAALREHDAARAELENLLTRLQAPEAGQAGGKFGEHVVPMAEFGAPGQRGIKVGDELAPRPPTAVKAATGDLTAVLDRRVAAEGTPVEAQAAAPATPPTRFSARGYGGARPGEDFTSARSAARDMGGEAIKARAGTGATSREGEVPAYDAIQKHEAAHDAPLERTVPARQIADRGYYEPAIKPGRPEMTLDQADPVRMANARKAIAEGQRQAIDLNVTPSGKITVTGGRHRLAAAIEADAPIHVKWRIGLEPAEHDVFRGAARAAEEGGDLEAALRGTKAKLDEGSDLGRMVRDPRDPTAPWNEDVPIGNLGKGHNNYERSPMAAQERELQAAARRATGRAADEMSAAEAAARAQNPGLRQYDEAGRPLEHPIPVHGRGHPLAGQPIGDAAAAEAAARRQLEATGIQRPGHPLSVGELEQAQDAALTRAASAADPIERAAALEDAQVIEQQLSGVSARPGAVEDVAAIAPAVTKYEETSAKLVEALGDAAPPAAKEAAAEFRAAEEAAARKTTDRAVRAIDDHAASQAAPAATAAAPRTTEWFGISARDRRLSLAKADKLQADAVLARARATESEARLASRAADKTAADARAVAEATRPKAPGAAAEAPTSRLGAVATTVGVAAELGIPGLPHPKDIPVIGPLLSLYIKYRALKASAGRFVGRIPATGDARAAALVARTKDKIIRAVDETLGLAAAAAPKARGPLVVAATALGRRVFDDGEPDAPRDASAREQAAVRIREAAAAVARPDLVHALVRKQMGGVVDPDLIAAAEKRLTAIYEHLSEVMPKAPPENPYAKREWLPSPGQAAELGQRLAVVADPSAAFKIRTPAAIDTLRRVSPRLLELAQQRLIDRVADLKEPVPYKQLVRASRLFDVALHGSLESESAALLQSVFAKPAPMPAPGPPQTPPVPSIAASTAIDHLYQPANQRRAGGM